MLESLLIVSWISTFGRYTEYWFSCSNGEDVCKKPTGANFKLHVNKNPVLNSNPSWSPFDGIMVESRSPDFWINIPF